MVTPLGRVTGWTPDARACRRVPVARRAVRDVPFFRCPSAAAPTAKVPEYIPATRQKAPAIDGRGAFHRLLRWRLGDIGITRHRATIPSGPRRELDLRATR